MSLKNLLIGVGLVAALGMGFLGLMKPGTVVERVQEAVGAVPGPEHLSQEYFDGGLTFGGGCFATSTTGTLSAAALDGSNCIYINPAGSGQAAITFTLPASTTMSVLIPKVGSCQTWWVDATDVAAGTTTTFAAGTGHDVVGLDATGAGTGADVIDGNEMGTLTMCRERNGDVASFVQEFIHAD